jgi:hypothetical protein
MRAKEVVGDEIEQPQPRHTVSAVRRSKLAHTQAIFEGLTLADHAQIETNAAAVNVISRSSDWLAHESVEYFAFSMDFREICGNLREHAQAKNMPAVLSDDADLTTSCVSCHEYLRRQRETKDMPGRVSIAGEESRFPFH